MFGDREFSHDYSETFYKEEVSVTSDMSFQATLYIVGIVVIVILLIACCCHCCCRRDRGQVLSPAPATQVQVQVPAPYPQQQYNAPYPTQVITTYPVHTGAQVAYPHPTGYPYPSMPAPGPVAAPYPAAPYPGTAYPPTAPSAPAENVFFGIAPPGWNTQAMPPSYDQAVCAKSPPSNPYASH